MSQGVSYAGQAYSASFPPRNYSALSIGALATYIIQGLHQMHISGMLDLATRPSFHLSAAKSRAYVPNERSDHTTTFPELPGSMHVLAPMDHP